MYVATSGTPYPLLLEREGMQLVLSHWNQKVSNTAPPKDQVVTMDDLGLTGLSGLGSAGDLASQLSGLKG